MKLRGSRLLLSPEDVEYAVTFWLRYHDMYSTEREKEDAKQPLTVARDQTISVRHTRGGALIEFNKPKESEADGSEEADQKAAPATSESNAPARKRGRPRAQPSSPEGQESASAALVAA